MGTTKCLLILVALSVIWAPVTSSAATIFQTVGERADGFIPVGNLGQGTPGASVSSRGGAPGINCFDMIAVAGIPTPFGEVTRCDLLERVFTGDVAMIEPGGAISDVLRFTSRPDLPFVPDNSLRLTATTLFLFSDGWLTGVEGDISLAALGGRLSINAVAIPAADPCTYLPDGHRFPFGNQYVMLGGSDEGVVGFGPRQAGGG